MQNQSAPPAKPAIVVFDLGKVLVDFDYTIAGRRLAARSKLSPLEVAAYLNQTPVLHRYESGLMTRDEFFAEVRQATGYQGSLAEFGSYFADIFTEIPAMIALHATLRRRGVPTYILSNTNDLAVEHIRRAFPFFAHFDGYVLSHEVRAMKPAPQIYEALEQLTGKRGAEILYLDDRPENVDAGAARGWQVILHATPEASMAAVRQRGLVD
jgi:HAD superfamily hydrolase (TIGR01509 family)